jgi:restriction system protein
LALKSDNLSPTKRVAAKTIYESFKILKKEGGELPVKDILNQIRENVEFTDWEKETYEKTGNVRWETILRFYSIDCIKAGFLRKHKGKWILTEEGEKAIDLGAVKLLKYASEKYKEWDVKRKKSEKEKKDETELEDDQQLIQANIDKLEEDALESLRNYLMDKNPYEFQDMVAALLRAMKYHTPFISPRGKDGGVDVIAYQDPLGVKSPRIKVQVKHKPNDAVSVKEIRSLIGILNKDSDIGLFVTSGKFSSDSNRLSRDSHVHVKLIDFEDFISLWKEFYDELTDEEKNMLPLKSIDFLGSND